MQSVDQLNSELDHAIRSLNEAQNELASRAEKYAHAEQAYRQKRAVTYLQSEGTVDARKAVVDKECSKEMLDAHLAEGLLQASLENVRNRRTILTAIQTKCSNVKAEDQLSRTSTPGWTDKRDAVRF